MGSPIKRMHDANLECGDLFRIKAMGDVECPCLGINMGYGVGICLLASHCGMLLVGGQAVCLLPNICSTA